MKYLLSLPENTVNSFSSICTNAEKYFPCSDPPGSKVGAGGGTSWIVSESLREENAVNNDIDKQIIIHGGGQSRRLPAYAPVGKSFIPVPIFRWERGQRLNQTLLDLQLPLLENLLSAAPNSVNTLIASGDALILSDVLFDKLPGADVISLGMSVDPALASNHGVFVCDRKEPSNLKYMLQKPDKKTLTELNLNNLFYIDTGIWLLSSKAVSLIMKFSGWQHKENSYKNGIPNFYDLYGSFGLSLGEEPSVYDEEISSLKTAIVPLVEGDFYHFGTSRELVSSSLKIQNHVVDQKNIWTRNIKPHPSIFTQNCTVETSLTSDNRNLWIENSHLSKKWTLNSSHVITGIPENDWEINLPSGVCLDIIPVKSGKFCIRPYGIDDKFRGLLTDNETIYLNESVIDWLLKRNIELKNSDIYDAPLFPVLDYNDITGSLINWFFDQQIEADLNRQKWISAEKLSSAELLEECDLKALESQRSKFRVENLKAIYSNHHKSVFFQSDLDYLAAESMDCGLVLPESLNSSEPSILMQDMMFRSRCASEPTKKTEYRTRAFEILQSAILEPVKKNKQLPEMNVYEDQIVWARSPVRIDLAGGWTDTPPNSNLNGGSVVTVSLELNGQPPLQAFVRPCKEKKIILRSIDLGEREVISTFEELQSYNVVGSPFSIPKAALALTGFLPEYCSYAWPTLNDQLEDFGSGIEISFLAAIPKGSGMGTSSILAATILGAISDFAGLNWDKFEICNRALGLEQLLTTGGGWQDQYGGVIPGLKLLTTERGWIQTPDIKWLPDYLFTNPEYKDSMLLYYTGITRVAKSILADIVEGMFLNKNETYRVLKEMKIHAEDTFEVIQRGRFEDFGRKISRSWTQNNAIDSGTSNEQIQSIIEMIDDYCIGYKLPGAGGGGYLYIVAKEPEAALKIRQILKENPPNKRARFVEMNISQKGLEISRS